MMVMVMPIIMAVRMLMIHDGMRVAMLMALCCVEPNTEPKEHSGAQRERPRRFVSNRP